MTWLIWQAVYVMMPAYFANMAPVIAQKLGILKKLGTPIDGRKKLGDGLSLFGAHKTWRGIVVAVIAGIFLAGIQFLLSKNAFFSASSPLDYSQFILIGFLLGLGAILGDLLKSFFKRRFRFKDGAPFVPFDQTDFVMGAYALAWPFLPLTFNLFLASLVMSFLLHIFVNHIAYYAGVRKEKW